MVPTFSYMIPKIAKQALDLIAFKNGYENYEAFKQELNQQIMQKSDVLLTKIHYLDHFPFGSRCMISHLPLHLEMEKMVICPLRRVC